MANGHGGYRKPSNPAPVSGPGKLSRRTDGGQGVSTVPGQAYGDAKQQAMSQRTAPMAAAQPLPKAPTSSEVASASLPPFQGPPLGAQSERPDEPITHGVDIGPGGGSEVLNLPTPPSGPQGTGQMTALLQRLSASDVTGVLGPLLQAAQNRGA